MNCEYEENNYPINDSSAKKAGKWDQQHVYDVLVIGGGIAALSSALALQQEGLTCIVAVSEHPDPTCHTTTFFSPASLRTLYEIGESWPDKAQLLATAIREGLDLAEQLINKYHIDCNFCYGPGYLYSQNGNDTELLNKIVDAAQKGGLVVDYSNVLPVPTRFEAAARFGFQAQLNTSKFLKGLITAFETAGGIALARCPVHSLTDSGHVSSETIYGTIKARKTLIAKSDFPMLEQFPTKCALNNRLEIAFTLKSGYYPVGQTHDLKEPGHYFTSREVNGKRYVVAGVQGLRTDSNVKTGFIHLEAHARSLYKIERTIYQWSRPYHETTDGLPFIGLYPGKDNIYVVSCEDDFELSFNSLAAKIISCQVTGKQTPYDDLFDASRQTNGNGHVSLPAA